MHSRDQQTHVDNVSHLPPARRAIEQSARSGVLQTCATSGRHTPAGTPALAHAIAAIAAKSGLDAAGKARLVHAMQRVLGNVRMGRLLGATTSGASAGHGAPIQRHSTGAEGVTSPTTHAVQRELATAQASGTHVEEGHKHAGPIMRAFSPSLARARRAQEANDNPVPVLRKMDDAPAGNAQREKSG